MRNIFNDFLHKTPHNKSWVYHLITITLFSSLLMGCIPSAQPETPEQRATATPTQDAQTSYPTTTKEPFKTEEPGNLPIWGNYPAPKIDPVTAIPPVSSLRAIPEEVVVWLLLGSDTELPFTGRTDAIHLILINPRLAKASLISIPSNLYVYIPGHTMQRINTAYALGGINLLRDTLAYNFGIIPDRYVLAHPGDFIWLVDDLGRLEVSVVFPLPGACNGIKAGMQYMDGKTALCYVSYQNGDDEIDRLRRQQQILRLIFVNLVSNGNLAKLPILYASYKNWVETDLSLPELAAYIPLALKLGDPERIKYFVLGWEAIRIWQLPDKSKVNVFLPIQPEIESIFEQALSAIMEPSPLFETVLTLEYQYTLAVEATQQYLSTSTPATTQTTQPIITPTPTVVITPQFGQTPTPTPTTTPLLYP